MNWESSKALTPLKHDLLLAFFAARQDFFLTGGSALGIFYLEHRLSRDLDLFSRASSVDWLELEKTLEALCERIQARLTPVTKTPSFRRFEVARGQEKETLDFVVEHVAQIDEEKNRFGAVVVDTLREIGVNKICMLLSRTETKDLVDLFFLSQQGFDVLEHLGEASRKEASLEPALLSYLVSQIDVSSACGELMIRQAGHEELKRFQEQLGRRLAEAGFPKQE